MNGLSQEPGVERTYVATTLPELLRKEGYRTIHAGKAHFAANGTPSEDPCKLGFDVNIAGHCAGGPGSYYGRLFRQICGWELAPASFQVHDTEPFPYIYLSGIRTIF